MPEPTTVAAGTSALGLLGLGLLGHAYAQEPETAAHTVVPVGDVASQPVGMVVDPSDFTGPGAMITAALVVRSALKGWTPTFEIKHTTDEGTKSLLRDGLSSIKELLAVLKDREHRE